MSSASLIRLYLILPFDGGAKPPLKGDIRANFRNLLYLISFRNQTLPKIFKYLFKAKCQIMTSPRMTSLKGLDEIVVRALEKG